MGSSLSPRGTDWYPVRLDREDPYLRLQSITIFVRDLDQSLQFYVDQLGFSLIFDGRHQPSGRRFVAVAPPDGAATLTLAAPEPGSEEYKLIGRSTHVAFVTEDVPAKFREWRGRGVRFQYTPRLRRLRSPLRAAGPRSADASASNDEPIWGGVFTRFLDVDGNSFTLMGFDNLSREIEAHRRTAAEKAESERRAAQELEIAKSVQARLFPQTLPRLQTLEYAGVCLQARPVGGDYYDFLNLGEERIGLVVGDISGKGIAAALLMANLQANLRSQCAIASDHPERFLRSVNQLFCENTTDSAYATLFFAEYADRAQRLRYASCGHLSALLLRSDDRLERLESTCTVLGLFPDWDCSFGERQLFSGDTLALYTDGITESFDEAGEEFGEERLLEVLRRHRGQNAPGLLASMLAEVQKFSPQEQRDDITLIVAKCVGTG